jgi:exodeoxyribonuclease VII large subunit
LAAAFTDGLRESHRRLQDASARVRHYDFRRSLSLTRTRLYAATHALVQAWAARKAEERARLKELIARLDALSPMKILDRGYALVFDAHGQLVKDASRLKTGEQISARVSKGSFAAEVKKTEKT